MAAPTKEQKASWPQPNYDDPENLHALIIGITVPALVLAVVCEYINCGVDTTSGSSVRQDNTTLRAMTWSSHSLYFPPEARISCMVADLTPSSPRCSILWQGAAPPDPLVR
jgi:hypothetical protein